MNKDQVKGRAEEVKGKVKEMTGKAIDDQSLRAKCTVEKLPVKCVPLMAMSKKTPRLNRINFSTRLGNNY